MAQQPKVQIQCPNCGTPIQATVNSIVDAQATPQLRDALLSGQLNVTQCPNCKQPVAMETPLVYHDAAADFLGVYLPPQMNLPEMERQKLIGSMTQALMNALPPEQRKGYFLNPRQYINRQTFMDAILGTLGISQEELDRQRKKMKLLEQALVMADDPKGLDILVRGNDAQMDYEFFLILGNLIEESSASGEQGASDRLVELRTRLMALTSWGKKAARQEEAVNGLREVKNADELLERIVAADPDQVDAMVVAARAALDYGFFQKLTERIDAASGAEKDRLKRTRDRMLELTEQMDEATRKQLKIASDLLRDLLQAENIRGMVRERAAEMDEAFMTVLSLNLQEAQKQNARGVVERLEIINDEMSAMVEESLPPEMRLINDLLRARYPDGTRALLKQHQPELTSEFLALMAEMADELGEREESGETAKRLRDIRAQAMLVV